VDNTGLTPSLKYWTDAEMAPVAEILD